MAVLEREVNNALRLLLPPPLFRSELRPYAEARRRPGKGHPHRQQGMEDAQADGIQVGAPSLCSARPELIIRCGAVHSGFRDGTTLGKTQKGLKQPLPIAVRSDRSGLGLQEEIERNMEKQMKQLKVRLRACPRLLHACASTK